MCRAYPGPRCSRDASSRLRTATNHLTLLKERRQALQELQHSDTPEGCEAKAKLRSSRFKTQFKNAQNRLAFAEKHFTQTPQGIQHYQNLAEEARAAGNDTLAEEYRKVALRGRTLRDNSYTDYHMMKGELGFLGSERSRVRALQSVTHDGEQRYNIRGVPSGAGAYSYPYPSQVSEEIRNMSPTDRQAFIDGGVTQWGDAEYNRAYTWQEEGHRPRWQDNPNARVRAAAGRRLSTESKVQRINMPDGQVVESRADLHLCERPETGEYVVARRLTVASSWEDMTPLHRTQVPLGSYLARDRGVAGNTQYSETAYTTRAEAEAAIRREKRNLTARVQAKSSAQVAREGFVQRLHRVAGTSASRDRLSRFDGLVWPRYREVSPVA